MKFMRPVTREIICINVAAVVCTYIQVMWAAPDGPSARDLSGSPISYLHWFCLPVLLFLNVLLLTLGKRGHTSFIQGVYSTSLLTACWLVMNYLEFADRLASWSTFSALEIWSSVFMTSVLTIGVCSTVFFFIHYRFIRIKS